MATAADLVLAYRDQIGVDADETIKLLVEFLSSYGMSESAVRVLCDHVDDEGMTGDLASELQENGLTIEANGPHECESDWTDEETTDEEIE